MIIKNNKFSTNAKVYKNLLTLKGLMFSKKLKTNTSILLKFKKERIIPIHMLFVFQSIDAVWINSKGSVVYIKRNIKPFTPNIKPAAPAIAILETQKNATKALKIGDRLTL